MVQKAQMHRVIEKGMEAGFDSVLFSVKGF